jgi:hypothetical protein
MKGATFVLALLSLAFAPAIFGQTITLSAVSSPPPAANVTPGDTRRAVLAFQLERSGMGPPVFFNALDATQTGTAVATDIAQWRLYWDLNGSGTVDLFVDPLVATSTSLNPGFTSFFNLLPNNLPRAYIVAVGPS